MAWLSDGARSLTSSDDEAEIRAVIDARASAMRNKEVQGILSGVTKDAVGFFLETPLEQSPFDQDLAGWFDSWVGAIGYEMRELHIVSGGDVAYAHTLSRMSGARTDGEETDLWFRETFCLRRTDGQWFITHIHESVPLYMDGIVRAAFDLKPVWRDVPSQSDRG
jgi:ketosteroid isomerase-like protein